MPNSFYEVLYLLHEPVDYFSIYWKVFVLISYFLINASLVGR